MSRRFNSKTWNVEEIDKHSTETRENETRTFRKKTISSCHDLDSLEIQLFAAVIVAEVASHKFGKCCSCCSFSFKDFFFDCLHYHAELLLLWHLIIGKTSSLLILLHLKI